MAAKKDTHSTLPHGDEARVQELLAQHHDVAAELRASTSRAQAETALSSIAGADEATQLSLLKALVRQHDTDAADVLLALNELAVNKAVRKESRRALIQLAGAKVYPSWTPEAEKPPTAATGAPRFWKGFVTATRDTGEVELVLCWEQGFEYDEARLLVFLLDFWKDGVKDFAIDSGNKRRIDRRIQEARLIDVGEGEGDLIPCTLAEGRRLLNEALSVNRWRDRTPHKDFRHFLPTIQQLILHATDAGEDRGLTFVAPEQEPDGVAANFAGAWSMGDFGLCYDLTTRNSPLREGLARDEWIEQRRKWADEAHPTRFEVYFIREREHNQQALWLPGTVLSSRAQSQKDAEIGWSLELNATPLSGTLPEMPMGTAVYKETGRHWFWTSYTLTHEDGAWLISRFTDEGAAAQGLPLADLQRRVKEYNDRIEQIAQEHRPTDPDAQQYYEEIIWRVAQVLHLYDALLVKLPLDRQYYEDAFSRAFDLRMLERAIVYLEDIAEHFPNDAGRSELLHQISAAQTGIAQRYESFGMHERAQRLLTLAETTARSALSEDTPLGYILLAELLMGRNQPDEARSLLTQAQSLTTDQPMKAQIEFDLATLAMTEDHFTEAQHHLERVVEIEPAYQGIWFNLGYVNRLQKNFTEAELYYKRSIEEEPADVRAYAELAGIYIEQEETSKAVEILEQGIRNNPTTAHLRALLANILHETGERRRALALLAEAEKLNPDLEIVQAVREQLNKK